MFKIGRKTLGLLLLLIGGIYLVKQWINFSFTDIFAYVWPILFVALIIELIFFYRTKEADDVIRFDKGAIAILIIVLLISGGMHSLKQSESGFVQGFSLMDFSGANGVVSELEEDYELSSNVEIISFEAPNARIRIEGTDEENISLTGTVRANEQNEADVINAFEKVRTAMETGNRFEYKVEKGATSSWFFDNHQMSMELTIHVPSNKFVNVDVTNGSVDVFNISKNVFVKTTNGRVEAEVIEGNVNVKNTNGTISILNINGDVDAETTNGRIIVTNVAKKAKLRTTNGLIEIVSEQLNGNWDLQTTNGNVTVKLPEDSDFTVEGNTSNGKVDGDFQWKRANEGNMMRENTEGTAVHGEGTYIVRAKGTNGNIQISLLR